MLSDSAARTRDVYSMRREGLRAPVDPIRASCPPIPVDCEGTNARIVGLGIRGAGDNNVRDTAGKRAKAGA